MINNSIAIMQLTYALMLLSNCVSGHESLKTRALKVLENMSPKNTIPNGHESKSNGQRVLNYSKLHEF